MPEGSNASSTDIPKDTVVSIDQLLALCPADARERIRHAYEFAERMHDGQMRQDGLPFITHPVAVAYELASLNMHPAAIAAGLLHDTIEDCKDKMPQEKIAAHIRDHFGADVLSLVDGVTKITRIDFQTKREAQVESLRKMILAMSNDIAVVVIKLCDRLHNMRTLSAMKPEKRIATAQETLDIFAPLANRFGISRIKSELEDLAMRWLMPEAYEELVQAMHDQAIDSDQHIQASIAALRDVLATDYPNVTITGRPKHLFSIYKKMQQQGLSFDNVHDLHALRVICDTEKECWGIIGEIHAKWRPTAPDRFKDYINRPKRNMYQSLHTTVFGVDHVVTEIQVRTRKMHQVAEYGIAAHWKYKESGSVVNLESQCSWLRQLVENTPDSGEPKDFLDTLTKEALADGVLCFTPMGRVIELPNDSTTIDFAYAVHTEVGNHCTGAVINGSQAPLRTRLKNGDVVEVQTSSNGHPSPDWLQFVASSRAKNKIKQWLKSRDFDKWLAAGRRAIDTVIREHRINVTPKDVSDGLAKVLPVYKMNSIDDLLVEIGIKSMNAQAVLARINPEWFVKNRHHAPGAAPRKKRSTISVDGLHDVPFRLAECCGPLHGQPIVAFLTKNHSMSIHRADCRNVARYRLDPVDSQRLHIARWPDTPAATQGIWLRVDARDRTGLLAHISGTITNCGVSINGSGSRSDLKKGTAVLMYNISVADAAQFEQVLATIRREKDVVKVARAKRGLD